MVPGKAAVKGNFAGATGRWIALQVLGTVTDCEGLLALCGDLRLFRGYDVSVGGNVSLTLDEFSV